MKKTTIILLILLCYTATYSQIQQGAKILDIGLSYSDSDNSSRFLAFQPQVGFGFKQNQVLYTGLRIDSRKTDFSNFEETLNIYSVIFGYEKFFELNPKIYFATFFNISGGLGQQETNPGEDVDITRFGLNFSPRLHYFINNKWSVVASIGSISYFRDTRETESGAETTNDSFSANLNFTNVNFGIRLNLNN